jgi:hypothetical protein
MHDQTMLLELFLEIEEAIRRIERRFSGINSPHIALRSLIMVIKYAIAI